MFTAPRSEAGSRVFGPVEPVVSHLPGQPPHGGLPRRLRRL